MNREDILEKYHKQVTSVAKIDQNAKKEDIIHSHVKCAGDQPCRDNNVECGHVMSIMHAYKCLYCGFWFCYSCAEKHFGQTVAEFKEENKSDYL